MRQLGVRLPEQPPAKTDVQTPSEILPHERFPVDVGEGHRVEAQRMPEPPLVETDVLQTSSEILPHERFPGEGHAVEVDRILEPPLAETDVQQTPSELLPHERFLVVEPREPYPVEVHRVELNPAEPEPVVQVREIEPAREAEAAGGYPVAFQKEEAPLVAPSAARWEEFHEIPLEEPRRRGRFGLDAMPPPDGPPWGLLAADREPERRSSFLTLAAPGIAALLAVGAIWWSGSLRDRVHKQHAVMNALEEQNQKLESSLAQMSVGHEAPNAPNVTSTPPAPAPQNTAGGSTSASQQTAAPPAGQATSAPERAVAPPSSGQSEKRQGASAPPSPREQARRSTEESGSGSRRPMVAEHAPEIVPPYPTLSTPQNAASSAANRQPAPNGGGYRAPFTRGANPQPVPAAGTAHPAAAPRPAVQASVSPPSAPSPRTAPSPASSPATVPPAVSDSAPASIPYSATANGQFVSPLAQNIEAVEALQRQSPLPLKEFHARAGVAAKATPNVRLAVQQADPSRGTYALVVEQGGSSNQLRGTVNRPVVFTDNATHRQYELVVLSIANQLVYGYVRPTH